MPRTTTCPAAPRTPARRHHRWLAAGDDRQGRDRLRRRGHRRAVESPQMPNLLAMSFEGELAPSFTLHCLDAGRTLPDGWGMGYYPAGEPSAAILKEPAPPQASMRSQLALPWETVASSLVVLPIRNPTWGPP